MGHIAHGVLALEIIEAPKSYDMLFFLQEILWNSWIVRLIANVIKCWKAFNSWIMWHVVFLSGKSLKLRDYGAYRMPRFPRQPDRVTLLWRPDSTKTQHQSQKVVNSRRHVMLLNKHMSPALRKGGLMQVCKVSSQIILCSPHRANQGRHFPLLLYFSFPGRMFLQKIQFRRKVSSLIILRGLHRLVWDATLRTCIKPPFDRARLNYDKRVVEIFSYDVILRRFSSDGL